MRSNENVLLQSQKMKYSKESSSTTNYKMIPIWYKKVLRILGPKRVRLMDMEEWSKGNGVHFTELSEWLGFRGCTYHKVRHDNRDGFEFDNSVIELGTDCHLEI